MGIVRTLYAVYGSVAKPGSAAEAKIKAIVDRSLNDGGDSFVRVGNDLYAVVAINQITGRFCAAIGAGREPFYLGDGLSKGPMPMCGDASTWRAGVRSLGYDPADFTAHGVYILQDTA